jgi:hypothetical protein
MASSVSSTAASQAVPRYAAVQSSAGAPFPPNVSQDTANFIRLANQGQLAKSPAQRTLSGLKQAAAEIGWTTLWTLLTIKGTMFCCGLLGWPFIFPAVMSAGKAWGKFQQGYNQ